jgi:polar amino acid transport system permease protein
MGGFEKKIIKFWRYFYENGGYNDVLLGLKNTLLIAIIGLVIGIVIGILIAAVRVMPKEKKSTGVLNSVCDVYVSFFRGTPMVVQLLLAYYVLLPLMGINLSSLVVSITVFGLNSGAYVSEIMRSGIQSIDPGQMEAGRALGLNFVTTMTKIIVPQAIKNILPTLGNEFIVLVKETSIVSFVGTADLYKAFNDMGTNSYEFMVPYIVMALIYIVLVLAITVMVKALERRLGKSDRRN